MIESKNRNSSLGETPAGLAALRGPFIPKQLLELMGRGSEVQLRVLEVVVRVAVLGEEHLVAMTTTTLLKPLLDLVQVGNCSTNNFISGPLCRLRIAWPLSPPSSSLLR